MPDRSPHKDPGALGPATKPIVALLAKGGRILEHRGETFEAVAIYREEVLPVPQNVLALLRRKRAVRREGGQGWRLQLVRTFALDPAWLRAHGHRHGLPVPTTPTPKPDAP